MAPIEQDYTIETAIFVIFRIARTYYKAGKLLWGFWSDHQKVVYKGKEYAKIGKRLYTQHAVDRTIPSELGKAAGGSEGRSIFPNFIEKVIENGTKTSTVKDGVIRTVHESRSVTVITEAGGKIVVTVITK